MGKESDMNRRKFMEVGIYAISGSIAAVSSVALAGFSIGPSFRKEQSKWIEIEAQDAEEDFSRVVLEWDEKDGWLTTNARKLVYVKRVDENEVIAIDATCTHLGCIVTWDNDQKIFKCPCHDGRYDAEGRVISGPPPRPLDRHKTKIEEGKILLATDIVPFGGKKGETV